MLVFLTVVLVGFGIFGVCIADCRLKRGSHETSG